MQPFHSTMANWKMKPSVSVSVSVYYVAVSTNVLSRHGSKLARPVIIHDIIHSLMCNILHIVDFLGSHDTTSLHDVLVYTSPGSPRRSPIQL